MLTLERLSYSQDDFRLDADLSLAPGSRTALIGPSGAGKSTLLALAAGFLRPAAGRVLWQGRDLTPLAPGERPIAMLFQDNNLFPHLTAFGNVALGLTHRRPTPQQAEAVTGALERVGLGGLGERKPGALSGGQIARVALARTLVQRRPLLLLDEPFGALGPALKAEMLALVGTLADDTDATLVMVTHEPADARALCPDTVVVADGRAEPPQPTGPLLDAPPPALAAYLGA